jgi:hypothetical protein
VTLQTKSEAPGQSCRECEQHHFMRAGAAFDATIGSARNASEGRKTSTAAGFSHRQAAAAQTSFSRPLAISAKRHAPRA